MTDHLLPGVKTRTVPPRVVCDSRRIITRARRIAVAREAGQVVLILAVDALFARYPLTHIPLLTRDVTVSIVASFNLLVAAHVAFSRKWPQWSARRIASTWCPAERQRFTSR